MRISDWSSDVCSSDLDTLLQAVWQSADGRPADRLDLQEVDDLLDRLAMGDLLAPVGAPVDRLLEQVALHLQHAAGHDVVEGGHAFEQRHVLESARDALARRDVGAHGPALDAAKLDAALLGSEEHTP